MDKVKTLKKNYEFRNVLNKGKFFVKKQIIIYIAENKKDENYIGIAINTKLCHAVKRNRLKRLIKENYREICSSLKMGYNIVFLWNKKASIENASYREIKKDMMEVFEKENMINK